MFALASAFQVVGDYGGHRHMMDWGGGWWIVMPIAMILFWGLLGLLAYWLVREFGTRKDKHRANESNDALAILDRRLAEGSITIDEYHERRTILTGVVSSNRDSS